MHSNFSPRRAPALIAGISKGTCFSELCAFTSKQVWHWKSVLSLLVSNSWSMSFAYLISAPSWMTKSVRKSEKIGSLKGRNVSVSALSKGSHSRAKFTWNVDTSYKLCRFTLFTAIVNCVPNCWALGSNLGVSMRMIIGLPVKWRSCFGRKDWSSLSCWTYVALRSKSELKTQ